MVIKHNKLVHILPKEIELKISKESEIINQRIKRYLGCIIPDIYRYKTWKLLFNTSHDGISYATMFNRAKRHYPIYILIEDTKKNIFGAYISQGIKESNKFYGTGESFVFSFKVSNNVIIGNDVCKTI